MNQNYKKYSFYLLMSLLITCLGAFVGSFINKANIYLYVPLSFILLFAFFLTKGNAKKIVFLIFCYGEGLLLSPIIKTYSYTSLTNCLIITILTTAVFLFIGLRSKDLSYLKNILFMSLLAFLIFQILKIFLPIPSLSFIGVLIFCGYIAYDINNFKIAEKSGHLSNDDILLFVMDMYLNLINLFIDLLDVLDN